MTQQVHIHLADPGIFLSACENHATAVLERTRVPRHVPVGEILHCTLKWHFHEHINAMLASLSDTGGRLNIIREHGAAGYELLGIPVFRHGADFAPMIDLLVEVGMLMTSFPLFPSLQELLNAEVMERFTPGNCTGRPAASWSALGFDVTNDAFAFVSRAPGRWSKSWEDA